MKDEKPAKTPKPTKAVVDRQKLANKVIAAYEAQAPVVAKGVDTVFAQVLHKGEHAPDVAQWMSFAARALAHTRDAMVDSDVAHLEEQGDDDAPRQARDAHEAEVRKAIAELQEVATGLFGAEVLGQLRLAGAAPADPRALVTHVQNAVRAMREMDRAELPKLRVKKAEVDLNEWADSLAEPADRLHTALGLVDAEARELQVTQAAKNAAIKLFDERFRASIAMLEGMLTFSGHQDLAERVRPALRTTGGEEAAAPATPAATGEKPSA
jgi:hypothetical protein